MFIRIAAGMLGLIGLAGVVLAILALQNAAPVSAPVGAGFPSAAPPPAPLARILVAAHVLRAGSLLMSDDFATSDVSPGTEPPGSFTDSVAARTSLRGAMIRRSLTEGEPLVASDVLNPGDRGFLAAVLGAGMRAVTVGVDTVSGTAGLIWPGDRVDIVLTQSIDEKEQPLDRRISGETVLANIRVIAVDQQLVQGGQATQPGAVAPANRTVTLEATPFDAERIAVASRLGRLSLTVRAAADGQDAKAIATAAQMETQPAPIAWGGDVSPALRENNRRSPSGRNVRVYRGSKEAEEVHF